MTIKDKLAHYEPKPLGEKGRYAVLLPLIYDVKTDKYQILYQVRSEHISQPGEISFPGGRVEDGETFQEAAIRETCEELNLVPDQIDIWGEIDYLIHQGRTIHCFVGKIKIENWEYIHPNEEVYRLFTVEVDTLLTKEPIYYTVTSTLSEAKNFPFFLVKNREKYNFGYSERHIHFYRNLTENIWGMTAIFTHRFTNILKDLESKLKINDNIVIFLILVKLLIWY